MLAPGSTIPEDAQKRDAHPYSVRITHSNRMNEAKQWCIDKKIDYHFGMPNPMYWCFAKTEDRQAFIDKGFGVTA